MGCSIDESVKDRETDSARQTARDRQRETDSERQTARDRDTAGERRKERERIRKRETVREGQRERRRQRERESEERREERCNVCSCGTALGSRGADQRPSATPGVPGGDEWDGRALKCNVCRSRDIPGDTVSLAKKEAQLLRHLPQ
ncbi:unnamed protein product [Arctogadus glacialis]